MPPDHEYFHTLADGPFLVPARGFYRSVHDGGVWRIKSCCATDPGAHLLERGTVVHGAYLTAPRLEATGPGLGERVLALPLGENDAAAATIREFLIALTRVAMALKRPFGFSHWRRPLYEAIARAGLVPSTFEEDGEFDYASFDRDAADDLLTAAAIALGVRESPPGEPAATAGREARETEP